MMVWVIALFAGALCGVSLESASRRRPCARACGVSVAAGAMTTGRFAELATACRTAVLKPGPRAAIAETTTTGESHATATSMTVSGASFVTAARRHRTVGAADLVYTVTPLASGTLLVTLAGTPVGRPGGSPDAVGETLRLPVVAGTTYVISRDHGGAMRRRVPAQAA